MDDVFVTGDPLAATEAVDNSAQKRVMNVFMIVDTSGSMAGDRIGSVNQAIKETVDELRKVQKNGKGVEIRLALMSFNYTAEWITTLPEPVDKFTFAKFTNPQGGTNAADAFQKLSEKLSRTAFMNASSGHYQPLILFLSDGESREGWESKLETLKGNLWYQCATRVAIAAGKEATTTEAMRLFLAFTGNSEMVIFADRPEEITKAIVLISVHASKWNTSHIRPSADTALPAGGSSGDAPPDPFAQDMQNATPDWWKDIKKTVDFPSIPTLD